MYATLCNQSKEGGGGGSYVWSIADGLKTYFEVFNMAVDDFDFVIFLTSSY